LYLTIRNFHIYFALNLDNYDFELSFCKNWEMYFWGGLVFMESKVAFLSIITALNSLYAFININFGLLYYTF